MISQINSMLLVCSLLGIGLNTLNPIPLDSIKVGGEIGRRIDITIYNNSMVIDIDGEFLEPFIKKEAVWGGYIGLGKTIDAFVRFAKYTNDPNVIERKDHIIHTITEQQEEDGYIGIFKRGKRPWKLWDIHEIAYLIYGLITEYRLYKNASALACAQKAGDYLLREMSSYPARVPGDGDVCWEMGTTGVETAMLCLYEETRERRYLDFVKEYMKLPTWDEPIVKGRWGTIKGHAYAHLKRCMAKEQLYGLERDESLLNPSKKVLDFILNKNGLVIIGTCGFHECWYDTHEGLANVGETCMTAYLIRWWNDCLRRTKDSRFGDLMERAIYNALFGAQSPDGRRLRYYTPFEGDRVYTERDSYCCPGNFRRIIAELPQMIFYISDNSVYVNLFTPCKTTLRIDNTPVVLEQDTKYPSEGKIRIYIKEIKEPKRFTISLRIPLWCKQVRTRINEGDWVERGDVSGSMLSIENVWKTGDTLDIDMEMRLRFIRGVQAQAGRVAVMYGPVVFCVNPDRNPPLKGLNLRYLTIDPKTLEGPFRDDTVRDGGMRCTVKGWKTTSWYPLEKYDFEEIVLTEFPDPNGQQTYLHVPNPEDALFENDEFSGLNLSL